MDALALLQETDAVQRLWRRDPSLFSDVREVQERIGAWMGWLGLGREAGPLLDRVSELASGIAEEDIADVVLLGMGGSSLAPLVMSSVLTAKPGSPRLRVLDTSSPQTVLRVMDEVDPGRAIFIVASKSGGTIEPNSLYRVFREWMDDALGREAAGRRFIATTDAGSSLEGMAIREGMRDVLITPPDVGGRYSALTAFGLAPAALAGLDVGGLVAKAVYMEEACQRPAEDNPAAILAAWAMSTWDEGRDKLTLVLSEGLGPLGLWVEQLVAESTGKEGKGLVPSVDSGPLDPTEYGSDRIVAVVRWADDTGLADWAEAAREHVPVAEMTLSDGVDLGAELVRWEIATALIGSLMGIDPFDQPNVTAAKEATAAIMDGTLPAPEPVVTLGGITVAYGNVDPPSDPEDLAGALEPLLATVKPGEYLAALVFAPAETELDEVGSALWEVVASNAAVPIVQLGPRYLHSTGQLHKGGANSGVFIVVTFGQRPHVAVPGSDYSLGDLIDAQAQGDAATLASAGRRVALVTLPSIDDLPALTTAIRKAGKD